MEAFIFEPLPGNPEDDPDYEDRAPDVRNPVITMLGQIEGHAEILPGDGWRTVFVKAFSLVCNEMRPSRIKYANSSTSSISHLTRLADVS